MFGFLKRGAARTESSWDYVHRLHRDLARGPEAAKDLWQKVVVNPDKSLTIKPEDGILFVRLMSHFGHPGPYLVALMRDYKLHAAPNSVGTERSGVNPLTNPDNG